MKGLLIKDYKLIMHNKKMFLILMVVWFLALQNYDGYSFLIGYSIMTFVLLVLNTLSLDEYYKSMPYLITLPVKRTTYVSEKYVLMLGFSLFGAGLSIALCILQPLCSVYSAAQSTMAADSGRGPYYLPCSRAAPASHAAVTVKIRRR